jgi:hypothetical protein
MDIQRMAELAVRQSAESFGTGLLIGGVASQLIGFVWSVGWKLWSRVKEDRDVVL